MEFHEWVVALIFLLHFSYWLLVVFFIINWKRAPKFKANSTSEPIYISVIIPVRNEEANIGNLLNDLEAQTHTSFEVIIIDDHSTDRSANLVATFSNSSSYPISLIKNENRLPSPKKSGILQGIEIAKGEFMATTDGDCRVGKNWLKNLSQLISEKKAKFVSGGVILEGKTLFGKLQTVEMMSLIGSGAASLTAGKPSMCNGANLAFEKKTFYEVGGYKGNEHLASGDDEFLLHKIHQKYPDHIFFLKDAESTVMTSPQDSLWDFYQQRKRWAGKWSHYQSLAPKLLALFIFLYHFSFLTILIAPFFGLTSWLFTALLVIVKLFLESCFLGPILKFYGKAKLSPLVFPLGLFYSFYAVTVGISSNFGKFTWKQRQF